MPTAAPARPAPISTNVRVVISHSTDVVASPKGIQIEGNLITWDWIDKARKAVCPEQEKPKTKVKSSKKPKSESTAKK